MHYSRDNRDTLVQLIIVDKNRLLPFEYVCVTAARKYKYSFYFYESIREAFIRAVTKLFSIGFIGVGFNTLVEQNNREEFSSRNSSFCFLKC